MSNVVETSTEYVEERDEFDEAAKRLLGVDTFLKILGAGLDRRDICREVAQRAFTFGLLDSPTQDQDLLLIRHVAGRVWDGPGDTGFDEAEEWRPRPRRLTMTPPVGWTRCTRVPTLNEPQCALYPRWSVHASCSAAEQSCHFHPPLKARSHSLTVYVGHEPLSRDMHDALMEVVEHCEWVQSSADSSTYDCFEAKAKLRGYLEALVQVGCISANHPLCLLT
ncbi:hypothetical protein ALQ33_200215 [Pseudomonas syringae pv. philadelphi]|uniref:Uncharacterized protein n=1 Tax=Pseudomonas syringae pv. philadelphi TaxID=251706 RepID=A0A3M3Z540_9PSED|nr:hypothetical protein [Pseudomonas syringae group genomosp. 3]RMO89726.1 hypothetical protein ALQ33_200215 [Pseudomonas syringae pv. philadelphi]